MLWKWILLFCVCSLSFIYIILSYSSMMRARTYKSDLKATKFMDFSQSFQENQDTDLTTYKFQQILNENIIQDFNIQAKRSQLSDHDRALYRRVIKTFTDFCDRNNIVYLIFWGSLIGSYRHHGFVPWDDDFDVLFSTSQVQQLKSAFSDYSLVGKSKLVLGGTSMLRWKAYLDIPEAKQAGKYNFKWPYVDLCFYDENSTHIWDTDLKVTFIKSDIFPLTRRPFEGMMLRAPRCGRNVLSKDIDSVCCLNSWNHKHERTLENDYMCVDCAPLKKTYPFVETHKIGPTVYMESLMFNKKVVKSLVVPDCVPAG